MNNFSVFTGLLLLLINAPWGAHADNPRATINITGTVVSKTCSFVKAADTFALDEIDIAEFTDTYIRGKKPIKVDITCGGGVSSVTLKPTGQPDSEDSTAFKNTGTSTNVAFRLHDAGSNKSLYPDGSRTVTINNIKGNASYTFEGGYVATTARKVTEGSFSSSMNLEFIYN